jgi:hypothetical protein
VINLGELLMILDLHRQGLSVQQAHVQNIVRHRLFDDHLVLGVDGDLDVVADADLRMRRHGAAVGIGDPRPRRPCFVFRRLQPLGDGATNGLPIDAQLANAQQDPRGGFLRSKKSMWSPTRVISGRYFRTEDIASCDEAGLTPHVPRPQRGAAVKNGFFRKDEFRYDAKQNAYRL